jgi:menaquinone-dependent protoporphyrinogen oxidase
MRILVAYATRHGATAGIAARIAQTLRGRGLQAEARPVGEATDIDGYDAFVVGSASYMGRWLQEASRFVREHRGILAARPVWLFSSGPVGTETVDAKGRDVLEASRPAEFGEFAAGLHPRDERVFFGAYDPNDRPVGLVETLGSWFTRMAAIREALPAGDFRDWAAIDAWAEDIAARFGGAASGTTPTGKASARPRGPAAHS